MSEVTILYPGRAEALRNPDWWRGVRHADSAADSGVGELDHFDQSVEYDSEAHRKAMVKRLNHDSRSYLGIHRGNVKDHALDGVSEALSGRYYNRQG
jgi:hypothetical protein